MGYNYQFVSKKHVYNQYIKTKIKLYNGKINTDSQSLLYRERKRQRQRSRD